MADHVRDSAKVTGPAGESAPDADGAATDSGDAYDLGPLVAFSEDRSHLTRLTALGVFAGAMVILGMAWYVHPDARGLGTHEQLGMGPCGFLITTGLPCPTCGMTTAFSHVVRGHVLQALWAQPAGAAMAGLTVLLAGVAVVVMITGRRLELNWYRVNPMHVLTAGLVFFLGSWAFKIVVALLERRASAMGG